MSLHEVVNDAVLHSILCRPSNSNFVGLLDFLSAQLTAVSMWQMSAPDLSGCGLAIGFRGKAVMLIRGDAILNETAEILND
jgi:hypothetical protein